MKKLLTLDKLKDHYKSIKNISIKDLLTEDPDRFQKYSINIDELLFDYSKNQINHDTKKLFSEIAEEANIHEHIRDQYSAIRINNTEQRAVLHTALRSQNLPKLIINGYDYSEDITNSRKRVETFVENIHSGIITSFSNKKFTDIIHIGIGGSHLGVQMLYEALHDFNTGYKIHFVSNVDSTQLYDLLETLNLETTMFIIVSKTFTTQETLSNAILAKTFIKKKYGQESVESNFFAISTNLEQVTKFGIKEEHTFGFWDFIGGRFSLWSAVSLSLQIAIGNDNFQQLALGASKIDDHFLNAHYSENIPFIMGMLNCYYSKFMNYKANNITAYSYRLRSFSNYLQQLIMESNGKSVNKEGDRLEYSTSPVIFGSSGTDSQHSYFQMMHQGTDIIPSDIIAFTNYNKKCHFDSLSHELLTANAIAQADALAMGKSYKEVESEHNTLNINNEHKKLLIQHRQFQGNRPSNFFMFKTLTPKTIGMLCALYEHRVFTEGILWNINSYDQWGVELGKTTAKKIINSISSNSDLDQFNSSTQALISFFNNNK